MIERFNSAVVRHRHSTEIPEPARWPDGHRAFFAFWALPVADCIGPHDALYESEGASHDAVEQGFHDQNPGADHFCAGRSRCDESGKLALRF